MGHPGLGIRTTRIMKTKSTILCGAILPILAGILIFSKFGGGHPPSDRRDGVSQMQNGEHPRQKQGEPSKQGNPHVESVAGLGEIAASRIEKGIRADELLVQYGLIEAREADVYAQDGIVPEIDVLFGEAGEILHLSFQKGHYQTKEWSGEKVLKWMEEGTLGGNRIVQIGIPELTLDNEDMMKSLLRKTKGDIDSIGQKGRENIEFEITPVIVEITEAFSGDPRYVGKRFPMLLERSSHGPPSIGEDWGIQWPERAEIVRRIWSLNPFLPDPSAEDGLLPNIGSGGVFDEPLLDAWRRRVEESGADEVDRWIMARSSDNPFVGWVSRNP